MTHILRIDASARRTGSVTRDLNDRLIGRFDDTATVTTRDLATGLPLIDEAWIGANFTPTDKRNDTQRELLSQSDDLIAELQAANTLVIGLPIYNFGVPSALKSWIDLVARVGVTFKYTETGPVGLLKNKRAIVTVASGGTQVGSAMDFATGYLRHVLGFIGITEVDFISADRTAMDPEGTVKAANATPSTPCRWPPDRLTERNSPMTNTQKYGLLAIKILVALAFAAAGIAKLTGAAMMVGTFEAIGIGQWFRYLTGLIELGSAVLLFVPGVQAYGAALLVCTMIGAVIAHVTILGAATALPAIVLGLLSAVVLYAHRRQLPI